MPTLTTQHIIDRLENCFDQVRERSAIEVTVADVIHLDRNNGRGSVGANKELRSSLYKPHVVKVMILTALARPRWYLFDGKIGLWAFGRDVEANIGTDNAAAVDLSSLQVDRQAYRDKVAQDVLPAIKRIWPRVSHSKVIRLQQDNPEFLIAPDDEAFSDAAAAEVWKTFVVAKPEQSPDLNVLDNEPFDLMQGSSSPAALMD
ncbi:TPA: hypothetical protein N0F65_001829 [Lagenidium giganteum]|uniref:Uncharacterized protein n=1 Tax=Lagenidium giganteum TaxID=4803 RepID=A0AAV2Z6Y4_9STRA|nr:TPA: hypothetical protein N0F65_001829 [Lagenidium giganteum]